MDITISGVVPVFTADIIYGYTSLEKGLISTFTFLYVSLKTAATEFISFLSSSPSFTAILSVAEMFSSTSIDAST